MMNETPAEIDTKLAAIYEDAAKAQTAMTRAADRAEGMREALAAKESGEGLRYGWYDSSPEKIEELETEAREHAAELERLSELAAPGEAEYAERRWSRFYMVLNTNGHLHRSMHCSTCFRTTPFGWVPERSGSDMAEIVATYGETACTVCFPEAPTFKGFEDGTSLLARLGAAEKAAKKAEKDAAKAAKDAKAVIDPETGKVAFKTDRTAEIELVDALVQVAEYTEAIEDGTAREHWGRLRDEKQAKADRITSLMVAKHGDDFTTEESWGKIEKKVAAKIRKYKRERAKHRANNPHLYPNG